MEKHKIKEIHFIELETTTAVLIRAGDQKYLKGWKQLTQDIFFEASRMLGEDAVIELSDETSDIVKKMFRDYKKEKKSESIHPYKVSTIYAMIYCHKLNFIVLFSGFIVIYTQLTLPFELPENRRCPT